MPASAASVFPEQTTTPPASLGVRWLRDRQQLRRQLDEGRLIKVVHFVRHGEGTHNVEQNYRCGLHGCWEAFCGTGRGYASARFRIGYLYRRINRRAFSGSYRRVEGGRGEEVGATRTYKSAVCSPARAPHSSLGMYLELYLEMTQQGAQGVPTRTLKRLVTLGSP
jgi:hypothetical protein